MFFRTERDILLVPVLPFLDRSELDCVVSGLHGRSFKSCTWYIK
jgi:hypothetical protein